jgi:hypothetical protein
MSDETRDHCWHPTGNGLSYGNSGYDAQRCCWCGANGSQRWRLAYHPVDGHGPHHTVTARVDEPVQANDGHPLTCPRA